MELKRRNLISRFKGMLLLFIRYGRQVCQQEVFSVCRSIWLIWSLDIIREVGLQQCFPETLCTELQSDNATSIAFSRRT